MCQEDYIGRVHINVCRNVLALPSKGWEYVASSRVPPLYSSDCVPDFPETIFTAFTMAHVFFRAFRGMVP